MYLFVVSNTIVFFCLLFSVLFQVVQGAYLFNRLMAKQSFLDYLGSIPN